MNQLGIHIYLIVAVIEELNQKLETLSNQIDPELLLQVKKIVEVIVKITPNKK